jgi:hypothetical protein
MLDPNRYFSPNVSVKPNASRPGRHRGAITITVERLAGGCTVYRLSSVTADRPTNETRLHALRERLP